MSGSQAVGYNQAPSARALANDASSVIFSTSLPGRSARPLAVNALRAEFSLNDGWDLSGLTLSGLWLRYLALGGNASPDQVADYAHGLIRPGSYQHNMIAQALNEHFTERGEDHPVGYQDIPALP